jgi:invasion protein IalB
VKESLLRLSLSSRLLACAAGLLGASVLPAGAQAPRQPAAPPAAASAPAQPQAATPERTTAQFGDWTVVCAVVSEERRCEVSQVVQDRQAQAAAAIAIGRSNREGPLRFVLRTPVNVTVSAPSRLLLDGSEAAAMPFGVCNVLGCFAELELGSSPLLARLSARTAEQPGRLEWRDATGAQVGIGISFRGLGAALDALRRSAP